MLGTKSLVLFAAVLLGVNSTSSLDVVPPTAECFLAREEHNLPCAAAHYPPDLLPPQRVHCAALVLHLSPGAESCSATHLPRSGTSQDKDDDDFNIPCGTVVAVRRGGCSFADKASAAWAAGYAGLILVDHAASAETAETQNELIAPNLLGLVIPPSLSTNAAPPSVVLVAENSTLALMAAAGAQSDECTGNGSCESNEGTDNSSNSNSSNSNISTRKCDGCFTIEWAASWAATDSASLYYDGVRLAKAQSYAEAAGVHARAAAAAPGFITPMYEQANALLRGGTLDSSELAATVERLGVLPLATPRDWRALRNAYLNMCLAAHARVFGGQRNDTTALVAPFNGTSNVSLQPLYKPIGWYVGAGLGMGHTASFDLVRGPLATFHNALNWLKVQWQQRSWRQGISRNIQYDKSIKPATSAYATAASATNIDASTRPSSAASASSPASSGSVPRVVVVTVATDEKPELDSLRRSVAASGLGHLVVLGKGRVYGTSGGTKLALMEEWLHAPPTSSSVSASSHRSSVLRDTVAPEADVNANPSFAALGLSDDTLVLFVDAYDVLVMPTAAAPSWAAALEQRFESFGARTIVSGETGCWPDPAIAPALPWPHFTRQPHFGALYRAPNASHTTGAEAGHRRDAVGEGDAHEEARKREESQAPKASSEDPENVSSIYPGEVPFPYPNSGGYVGRAGYLRTMLRAVMDDVRAGHVAGGGTIGNADDQRWLQRHWLRNPQEVKVDVYGEVFLSLHRLQRAAGISTSGPAHALGSPAKPRHGWTTTSDQPGASPPPRDIAPRFAAAFQAWADAAPNSFSNNTVVDQKRLRPPVLWLDAGSGASIAPLIVHGNGHGKRALRIISCQLGLHCHWKANATASG